MANQKYSLEYRTFDQLFEDVAMDFSNYKLEGLVQPQTLIKIARKCNYDLGFRIYRDMHAILEVENGKARLPNDFNILNVAFVCGEATFKQYLPQGTHIEERAIGQEYVPYPGTPEQCPTDEVVACPKQGTVYINDCDDAYELVQILKSTTASYKYFYPLYLTPHPLIQCGCSNTTQYGASNKAEIEDGWLLTNFKEGKVYISYTASMIDEDGNLLVPDHELLNEYYEYALKERILENLVMEGENVGERFNIIAQKLRMARNNALSLVNTPDFKELQDLHRINRKAQYHKFYDMFRS